MRPAQQSFFAFDLIDEGHPRYRVPDSDMHAQFASLQVQRSIAVDKMEL